MTKKLGDSPNAEAEDTLPVSYLSSASRLLIAIASADPPNVRMSDIAEHLDLTSRTVANAWRKLEQAGVLQRSKAGRRNVYAIDREAVMVERIGRDVSVGEFLDLFAGDTTWTPHRTSKMLNPNI